MRRLFIAILTFITIFTITGEIRFNPIALDSENRFLFNSIEIIGGNEPEKTLFYGSFSRDHKIDYEAISFYPESMEYHQRAKKVFIQNRIGLFAYDLKSRRIEEVSSFPGLTKKNEYTISRLLKAAVSPDTRYILGKTPVSPSKSTIILYDTLQGTSYEVVKEADTLPGQSVAYWSPDSNYFIYEKENSIYYFSIKDFLNDKQLSEEWRLIGRVKLNNCYWTAANHLIWIEKNVIYKADPNQFYYRSIYKSYLRQGEIIGKIPFQFEPSFDSFIYNDETKTFVIVREGSSIFYYSLTGKLAQNPYIQLNDNMRFDRTELFPNGEGIASVNILLDGKVNKSILLLKKGKEGYFFRIFNDPKLEESQIYSYSVSRDYKQFVINSSSGALCYSFSDEKLLWHYDEEQVISSANLESGLWLLGGAKRGLLYSTDSGASPIFAASLDDAALFDNRIVVELAGQNYYIDKETKLLSPASVEGKKLLKNPKNGYYRLLSRQINKGFYEESIYLKELYSGKQLEVTGEPILYYTLYQPELTLDNSYYLNPKQEKYEVSLVFDCIKTAEGMFPILETLQQFQVEGTFFINGNFIDINPVITRELSLFDHEVGNMFQYYVNLTGSNFLIDKTFIRQGLSSNEEKYYNISKQNFVPYWHAPMYSVNESIIKFGLESGYRYVTYNLDSLDWVGQDCSSQSQRYNMSNRRLIARILSKIKPGQTIIFSTGKNYTTRSEWLFNDFDILISELVRSGYTFDTISGLMSRYRFEK